MERRMNLSNIADLLTLRRTPIEDRRNLPRTKGIYFVFSGDTLIYIGKTKNSFRSRWGGHHRYSEFRKFEAVSIACYAIRCSDSEMTRLEREAILVHRPPLNERVWDERKNRGKASAGTGCVTFPVDDEEEELLMLLEIEEQEEYALWDDLYA